MPDPRSVLVIVTQRIGDVLLTTPLIEAVRARWPQARIDVLGFAGTLAPLAGNLAIADCIAVERKSGWREQWRLLRRLWRRYDFALVTQAGDRAHLYGWIAARTRSALVPLSGSTRGWKTALAQHAVIGDPERHAVLDRLMLLEPWLPLEGQRVALVPPARRALPADLAALRRRPSVAIHVPALLRYKQWPVEHYRTVTAALLAEGVQVWLTGAANPNDLGMTRPLLALGDAPRLVDAVGKLDFGQLAELLAGCDAFVGPDTSVTHLAAAVGVPTIALYGPTPPTQFGPWPMDHAATPPWRRRGDEPQRIQHAGPARAPVVLMQGPSRADIDCVPCGRAGCDDHAGSRAECLEKLAPERVLAQVRALLAAPVLPT